MKKVLFTVIFSVIATWSYCQSEQPHPCGTQGFKSDWLKKYQANPGIFELKSDEVINIPITVNRLGDNDGEGRMRATNVIRALCRLQQDFEGTDIEFYLKSPIKNINDSDFHEHGDVVSGGLKMFEYNEEGAINCYLVRGAAGNCGYNLPWAGVAVQESCARPEDHTWAHEMGHALALPHPFLGWEGGVSHDNSEPVRYNEPAPEFVLYNYTNFKDSLILDTVIIDTAWVEKMDGSNCHEAADGFCDTKPDYLYQRWPCANDTMSFTQQLDPDSIPFKSDASLFMSYAFDNCSGRFSNEQIQAMRANAIDEKGDFTSTGMIFPEPVDPMSIELLYPVEDEVVYFEDVEFAWSEEQEDQFYLFQVGVEPSFSLVLFDTIVNNPSMVWSKADASWGRLYWRVRPFTANHFCTDYSSGGQFFPTETTSATEETFGDFKLFPNIIDNMADHIYLSSPNNQLHNASYRCLDMNGRQVSRGTIQADRLDLNTEMMHSGIYFIQVKIGTEPLTFKLVKI